MRVIALPKLHGEDIVRQVIAHVQRIEKASKSLLLGGVAKGGRLGVRTILVWKQHAIVLAEKLDEKAKHFRIFVHVVATHSVPRKPVIPVSTKFSRQETRKRRQGSTE